ncbi:MAG: hypothetical protein A2Y07_03315 [Planctomycetes bacterium GWF2_50_10]|nr:MAG: hypothetical protein A2Y07_03315 [Planctomycetes bacterium GWF2_50_10]
MINVLGILKHRWPEILLIMGLEAAATYTMLQFPMTNQPTAAQLSTLPYAALLFVVFWTVANLLRLGLMRTAFTDGPMTYDPWHLLKIGYHYFWRMVGFSLIIAAITAVVVLALMGIMNWTTGNTSPAMMSLCMIAATTLLVKPTMFGPTSIVVLDCPVMHALGFTRLLKLLGSPQMLGLFLVIQGLAVVNVFMPRLPDDYDQWVSAGFALLASAISISAYLHAVKYIAATYIDQPDDSADTADHDKETIEIDN